MTPDSKHVIAGSIAGRNLTVIDAESEEAIWTLFFDAGVRPMSFETNPDGSTRRIFVQLSNFHGFAIVDFDRRREVMDRIELPEVPEARAPHRIPARLPVTRPGRHARRHHAVAVQ